MSQLIILIKYIEAGKGCCYILSFGRFYSAMPILNRVFPITVAQRQETGEESQTEGEDEDEL